MTDRPRQDDEVPGRVHGAWTTPAVVVRRPDGSVVGSGPHGSDGDGPAPEPDAPDDGTARPDGDAVRPRRARPRPRRIPGAPGSVLLAPSLTDIGTDPAGRRVRRNSGTPATVTPLPPRVRPAASTEVDGAPAASGAADGAGTLERPASRPSLRVVGQALRRGAQPSADRHRASGAAATGPSPTRPGEPRPQRVLRGLRALDLDRLLPADPEERAERFARWQRRGVLVAAVVVACVLIYTVFPVRTALELRAAEDRARERQAAFERENPILEDEVADLETDARIEEEARELGLVYPGEESYGIYPAPDDTVPAPSTTPTTTRPGG